MDIYLTSLAIGGVGLVAMAASGIGQHGHGGGQAGGHGGGHGGGHAGGHGGGHAGGGHGWGHAGGHAVGHAGGHGHAADAGHAGANAAAHAGTHATHASTGGPQLLLSLMSPRLLFSVCLGVGTAGILLRPILGGPLLLAAALAGGVLFEMVLVRPLWNALMGFASNPALSLESAVSGEATAVTNFDANGQGLIAIEMDGQLVQLLGTLQSDDRAMAVRIAAGAKLRVEDVDAARNRCTVSLL